MTASALWAAVRGSPADDLPKLVLADWLEENGSPTTGTAIRWCVARDKWPRVTKKYASWYTDPTRNHPGRAEEVRRATLPTALFAVACGCDTLFDLRSLPEFVHFHSPEDAVGYVRYALSRLAEHAAPIPVPDPTDTDLTGERIDELLRFLPTFTTSPYPTAPTPTTDEFFRLADQPWWQNEMYRPLTVGEWVRSDRRCMDARLDHVQQMLTYCVRAERFADGTGGSLVGDGRVGMILQRLTELRDTV